MTFLIYNTYMYNTYKKYPSATMPTLRTEGSPRRMWLSQKASFAPAAFRTVSRTFSKKKISKKNLKKKRPPLPRLPFALFPEPWMYIQWMSVCVYTHVCMCMYIYILNLR